MPASLVLTAEILKTLRTCNSIGVRAQLNERAIPEDSEAGIRVTSTDAKGTEITTILATYARCEYYGNNEVRERFARGRVSSVVFHYPNQETTVGSILQVLKPGDEIEFVWGIGAFSSPALEAAGFVGDVLKLGVKRTGRTGKVQRLTFDLDVCITRHDSSSRMIRPR